MVVLSRSVLALSCWKEGRPCRENRRGVRGYVSEGDSMVVAIKGYSLGTVMLEGGQAL
jgi:hypothetical protein